MTKHLDFIAISIFSGSAVIPALVFNANLTRKTFGSPANSEGLPNQKVQRLMGIAEPFPSATPALNEIIHSL